MTLRRLRPWLFVLVILLLIALLYGELKDLGAEVARALS